MTFLTYEILKEMIVRNELNRTHRHREGTYGWGAYDWEKSLEFGMDTHCCILNG